MTIDRQILIGLHLGNGYGSQPGAWRMPGVDPQSYTSFDARVKQAQAAKRGKFQFLFLPDGPGAIMTDIETESPSFNLDVMLTLTAVARETDSIGLIATGSTTFNEPFNLAQQFKALDVMSHGRVDWNANTSIRNQPQTAFLTAARPDASAAHARARCVALPGGGW